MSDKNFNVSFYLRFLDRNDGQYDELALLIGISDFSLPIPPFIGMEIDFDSFFSADEKNTHICNLVFQRFNREILGIGKISRIIVGNDYVDLYFHDVPIIDNF